eukprot:gb/GECH01014576.1/.p1 GENE.gb/GECH01014576.1/~~gb/GECH01014576.1/.p1  ORF type:complete len:466 (+),score=90.73 gb/GECH01014576.1/:1-1398(+)
MMTTCNSESTNNSEEFSDSSSSPKSNESNTNRNNSTTTTTTQPRKPKNLTSIRTSLASRSCNNSPRSSPRTPSTPHKSKKSPRHLKTSSTTPTYSPRTSGSSPRSRSPKRQISTSSSSPSLSSSSSLPNLSKSCNTNNNNNYNNNQDSPRKRILNSRSNYNNNYRKTSSKCIGTDKMKENTLFENKEQNLMAQRQYMDPLRWFSVSRPQYKYSCGISSLTSVWNFLFSTLGYGNRDPITQEQALNILGFQEPFTHIRFGPFTGNTSLFKWFRVLNKELNVEGNATYLWKAHGRGRQIGREEEDVYQELKDGLGSRNVAFIYHCKNHYLLVIGYQDSPMTQEKAFTTELNGIDYERWILLGEISKNFPPIMCVKWSDVAKDITLQSPYYFNIRHPERGVREREKAKDIGGNTNCILKFEKGSASKIVGAWEVDRIRHENKLRSIKFDTSSRSNATSADDTSETESN